MNPNLSENQIQAIQVLSRNRDPHGIVPRVHGNGFIQLDIGPGERLHIWGHPDLPRQKQDTGIHDHTFDFVSTCIAGRVVNANYMVDYSLDGEEATHKIYVPVPREGEDTELEELEDIFTLVQARVHRLQLINAGESYSFQMRDFHETFSDRPSATIMKKGRKSQGRARVLVPLGAQPDNDFRRQDFPVDHLWAIIHEVLA